MKISILLPTYNGAKYLSETIDTILSQDYNNFDLIVQDDCSKDNTVKILKKYHDSRIKIIVNKNNLGYPKNLEAARKRAKGDILFLMGQDDILAQGTLKNINTYFTKNPDLGAVTRPYYWFQNDTTRKPIRLKNGISYTSNTLVDIKSSKEKLVRVIDSLDQLSGLAYRTKFMTMGFHPDIFPCHIYPFLEIMKKHPILFQKDITIAVRIASSQSRWLKSIYDKSPLQSWVEMIINLFPKPKYSKLQTYLIQNFVARNYVGQFQVRNYGSYRYFLREFILLIKYRWQNLLSPSFWAINTLCAVLPRSLCIWLVDQYKDKVLAHKVSSSIYNTICSKS